MASTAPEETECYMLARRSMAYVVLCGTRRKIGSLYCQYTDHAAGPHPSPLPARSLLLRYALQLCC